MNCLICNKEFKTLQGLSRHLGRGHPQISIKDYYLKYLGKMEYCGYCGSECKFIGLTGGFKKTCCSKECRGMAVYITHKNKIINNETRKRMSNSAKEKPPVSDETKKNMSIGKKKSIKENPEKFKKWQEAGQTQKAREKRSKSEKEWIKNHPEKHAQKVKNWREAGQTSNIRYGAGKTKKNNCNNLKDSNFSEKNYFLYLASNNEGLVKIGTTGDLERRLEELIVGYDKNINFLDTYHGNYNEMYKLEAQLHRKYDKYNVLLSEEVAGWTEWFEEVIIEDVINDFKKLNKQIN